MHEFSLIASILSIIDDQVREHQLKQVDKVKLIIGSHRMVHFETLTFAFDQLRREPLSREAVLEMEEREGFDFYIEYIEGE
ncbi:hydrogenase/urease maturation nickel metallochaperone HypA [Ammoniphilus sp. YIM 78166]|uniref:hydrogenase/urease maturation nickel metallochaperone HypA n=1 Tax=Ammoniphilus sp. YIM 78166 TaxID=1644106 RepID=UPI0010701521|nr:hydrogenase/urease maturation nickel metallochaperone HypA [Ammoniphilus sp. YIM 78166]